MLGEKACAKVSPHLYITVLSYCQVHGYPPLWQLHSVFVDFSTGVCQVRTITTADSDG